MITTRERIKISELVAGTFHSNNSFCQDLNEFIPIGDRHFIFTNMGKAAFEQIVINAQLENSKILLPAFFPDDFVGIFRKYNITPIFSDVYENSYHLNIDLIEPEKLVDVKALIMLHTFGLPADGKKYKRFCENHNLLLIEDCARAFGAKSNGKLVGSFGNYAIFSLPKCTPLRQGGIAISQTPINPILDHSHIGLSGFLHNLTLIKVPFLSWLESIAFNAFADTPIYPREVGIYKLLPSRELDKLGKFFLKAYLPYYKEVLKKKRLISKKIKSELEPLGFKFQADDGNHIFTSLSLRLPGDLNAKEFKDFLIKRGVKASSMWTSALGVSKFSQKMWNINPTEFPNTLKLSKQILQLPVSRFQKEKETKKIIALCKDFVSG